jgi:integrase
VPARDTRSSVPGVYARHKVGCVVERLPAPLPPGTAEAACDCEPAHFGAVWDRSAARHRKTKHFACVNAANAAREKLEAQIRSVDAASRSRLANPREREIPAMEFSFARTVYLEAVRAGVALNKLGRPYRPRSAESLAGALHRMPTWLTALELDEIRPCDIQLLTDELVAEGLSGSSVRSAINAIRSLYSWALARELASQDPTRHVRLPAMNATPRDRVATPAEFAMLLDPLDLEDRLPYALAAYASARNQEIRRLDWSHVVHGVAIELAADEDARKPGGSWRVVPLVAPLASLLRRAWEDAGTPDRGKVCRPRRPSASGMVSLAGVHRRVCRDHWNEATGLQPILFHEARHTAATWLDHAGVSPKVASEWMGHKTPAYQPGAAAITLRRYTHVLPGELKLARVRLGRFLAERSTATPGRSQT